MDFDKDYYAILGLENTVALDEIKKTYRVLAKQYHPDVNKAPNATEIFNAISEAYEVLSDERQRAEYDAHSTHGGPERTHRSKRSDAQGGISTERGHATEHAPTIDSRLERTLLLSLVVPGVFQLASGERKMGVLLLAGYIIFWALAILYGVEIGVLAVLVWAIAILDSYYTFRKRSWDDAEPVK
jgi:curved DNA-binding protein CbpA